MSLAPGAMVTGSLRLVEKLGEGGMGSVWVAEHLALKTQVAVKFISPALIEASPGIAARFSREAALAAQIQSPHVVHTYDHGETEDGIPFIVMELLEGESLDDRLERDRTLSLRETVTIVAQVSKALGRAHKLGIVHRDIKPANLFLVDSGYELFAKVLDFGIAKQTDLPPSGGMTATGAVIGTPDYMSPEQMLGAKGASFTADLWALAVVAYRALTGRLPFLGETLAALVIAINKAELTPPSKLRADLPPEVDAWFARALHRDVQSRFGSAKEMSLALVRLIRQWAEMEDALLTTGEHETQRRPVGTLQGGFERDAEPARGSPPPEQRALPVVKGIEATLASAAQHAPGQVDGGVTDTAPLDPRAPDTEPIEDASAGAPPTTAPLPAAHDPTLLSAARDGQAAMPSRSIVDHDTEPLESAPKPARGATPSTFEGAASTLQPAGLPRRGVRWPFLALGAAAVAVVALVLASSGNDKQAGPSGSSQVAHPASARGVDGQPWGAATRDHESPSVARAAAASTATAREPPAGSDAGAGASEGAGTATAARRGPTDEAAARGGARAGAERPPSDHSPKHEIPSPGSTAPATPARGGKHGNWGF
ncbi:MAG: protein kinase [Deltaproteobacteria bacterium]|nr:protein kinase [Deltaproteobacteria bacterium]